MRRSRRSNGAAGIPRSLGLDLAPLVDVVFLLIIFFMVSTTFISTETGLPVDLPSAQTGEATQTEIPTVTITREQAIFLGDTPLAEAELVGSLRAALAAVPSGAVVLRADQSVPHGLTVRVMDLIRQAGASRIAVATGN